MHTDIQQVRTWVRLSLILLIVVPLVSVAHNRATPHHARSVSCEPAIVPFPDKKVSSRGRDPRFRSALACSWTVPYCSFPSFTLNAQNYFRPLADCGFSSRTDGIEKNRASVGQLLIRKGKRESPSRSYHQSEGSFPPYPNGRHLPPALVPLHPTQLGQPEVQLVELNMSHPHPLHLSHPLPPSNRSSRAEDSPHLSIHPSRSRSLPRSPIAPLPSHTPVQRHPHSISPRRPLSMRTSTSMRI